MPRIRLFAAVLLVLSAAVLQAQVAVTSSGFGTQAGASFPMAVPSPPLMFTPTIHLGSAPTTSYYATGEAATLPGTAYSDTEEQAPVVMVAAPAPAAPAVAERPFNFGVAQFSSSPKLGGNRADLAAVARKLKEEKTAMNARTFTNSDIQRMQDQWKSTPVAPAGAPNGTINNNSPVMSDNPLSQPR